MNSLQSGQIITFYSYKGGTGRTMALANIGCLLGSAPPSEVARPPRVLALDWDFEAPGLHRYFRPYLEASAEDRFETAPGCLDLFTLFDGQRREFHPSDFVANRGRARQMLEDLDFDSYLLPTVVPGLRIMKAGRFDADYGRRVSEFQWDRLFRETIGLFAGLADYLRQHYDYVLVDSRTGISDTSGICTMLLPDKLVVVFTPNQQSLTGIDELTRKALAYRKSSPDGRPLTVFPLPSRIEMARPALMEAWRMGGGEAKGLPADLLGYQPLFEQLFDEVFARKATRLKEYFDTVMLQHIPDYAFGEPIAVMLEETDSRLSLRSSYAAFAEYLTELQAPWESLALVRIEREIERLGDEAKDRIAAGDLDTALRIAYSLMERKPPPDLFEPVARAILEVAQAAYPRQREMVSKLLSAAIDRAMGAEDLDPMQVADVLVDAGRICLRAGDYGLALHALQHGLHRMRPVLGEDAPAVLAAEEDVGEALWRNGELQAARALQEKVLATRRRVLGEEHPETLTAMNNLALTLSSQGDLESARTLQEQELAMCRRILGEEHPETLTSMNNLATTLHLQGDLKGAQALQEKVLDTRRRLLGEEHADTLTAMNNLASTLLNQGNLSGARTLEEKVLEIRARLLGQDHPETLLSLNNLAAMLHDQGDLEGARPFQEQVLATRRRVLGEKHPDTLLAMSQLMQTAKEMGDMDTVINLSQELTKGLVK